MKVSAANYCIGALNSLSSHGYNLKSQLNDSDLQEFLLVVISRTDPIGGRLDVLQHTADSITAKPYDGFSTFPGPTDGDGEHIRDELQFNITDHAVQRDSPTPSEFHRSKFFTTVHERGSPISPLSPPLLQER